MEWSTYSTRPRPDWNNLNLDSFVDVVKTSLVDPAYGFIRNARINCGWKNGKKVKCGPNAIKIRKQRAEDRAIDLANFLKSQMMNKQNFKGCIDCKSLNEFYIVFQIYALRSTFDWPRPSRLQFDWPCN